MLVHTEGNFASDFELVGSEYASGIVHEADGFRLKALGNTHLPLKNGRPQSYSFRVDAGGRSLVYSGDMHHVDEIEPQLEGRSGADGNRPSPRQHRV